jgi:hypothetical protein
MHGLAESLEAMRCELLSEDRVPFRPGDEIFLGPGKTLRVLAVVPVDEEGSPYVGLLKVEAT